MGNYCCGEDKPSMISEKDIQKTSITNPNSQKFNQNLKVKTENNKEKQNGERQKNGSNDSNGKNGNNNNINNVNNDKSPLMQFNMYKGQSQLSINDFQKLRKLGQGAFGQVFLVQKKDTKEQLAMKYIPKVELLKSNMVERSLIEKKVLQDNQCPFLVDLKYCFQSQNKIYYLMEYIPGGQLFEILQGVGRFTEDVARFIIAEIILGIELMHDVLHVIYRDLKPENILLTADGHIKIADFGLSKIFKDKNEKTYTFAGTPEYLAPEIILNKGHNKDVDIWCIGILLYELLLGSPPFTTNPRNLDKIQAAILRNKPVFPNIFSESAIDIIKKLLQTKPEQRLGSQDFQDIKEHEFFKNINWKDLLEKKVKSPLQRYVRNNDLKQTQYCKPRPIYETPVNPGLNLPYIKGLSYNPDLMQIQQ